MSNKNNGLSKRGKKVKVAAIKKKDLKKNSNLKTKISPKVKNNKVGVVKITKDNTQKKTNKFDRDDLEKELYGDKEVQEQIAEVIEDLSKNDLVTSYLDHRVSKNSIDVIKELLHPKTDEDISQDLDLKINSVRRILNILQGFGVTNYIVSKSNEGWLSFYWYINISKIKDFLNYVVSVSSSKLNVNDNCNDYFVCEKCYETDKLIFTFDSAFETNFKCPNCESSLKRVSKTQAINLAKDSQMLKKLKVGKF
jgi:transcription factor E